MQYDVYVVGMRVEKIVDMGPGEDIFDMEPMENEVYKLFCVTADGRAKYIISLSITFGWCGSGYTTASWGNLSVDHLPYPDQGFGAATHLPKDHKPIKLEGVRFDASYKKPDDVSDDMWFDGFIFSCTSLSDKEKYWGDIDIKNNVFTVSFDGNDSYYPSGGMRVNMDLFEELPRAFEKRPVWIFSGESGTGKSTIGHILKREKVVYETDSANNGDLPKEIWADVVVVGNKWKNITVDEVIKHLPEGCEPVVADFAKQGGRA